VAYPRFSFELGEPCARRHLAAMLRGRSYRLHETRYKKDRGLVRVYMYDPWADPMLVLIGEYLAGEHPDWGVMYDAAMEVHLEHSAT